MKPEPTIEQVKQYWDKQPCNINHSKAPFGTKQYFDEVEKRKYFVEPHIREFADFPQWSGKRVLEIGCGIGTDTINFARAGARVEAMDVSNRSLGIAYERAGIFALHPYIEFWLGSAETSPPHGGHDLAYAFGVLHHTPNPGAVLDFAYRCLKSGPDEQFTGRLKLMVYHRWSWKRLCMLFGTSAEAQPGCPIVRTYTRRSIRELLEDHGFEVESMSVEHIFKYQIEAYKKYEYKTVWYFRWMSENWFEWLEHRIGWHLCVTARKTT